MADPAQLPATVAPDWRPRPEEWHRRAPSRFADRRVRPLFIGGCPRSGTTMLQVVLDMHPELAVPRETNFIRQLWWQRARFGDLRDPANRRRVAEWIFDDQAHWTRRLREGRIGRRKAIRRVAQAPPTIGSIVQACLALYAELHGKPRWGDKRPAYSGFIGPLLAMFPDAQYVNVVRDPRGTVASQLGMGWDAPGVAVPAGIARWEGSIARTDHFARGMRPDQLLDIRYEDLVSAPEAALERVLAFAGLPSDEVLDTMISGERRRAFHGPNARVAEPVTTASVERWRERLAPHQVALVERATAPLLDRFGYRAASGLAAEPAPEDLRELQRQRRLSRREWRTSRRDELVRRAVYRRPVAALA